MKEGRKEVTQKQKTMLDRKKNKEDDKQKGRNRDRKIWKKQKIAK